jgi:integrase
MQGWLFQSPAGTQVDPSNLRKLFNRLLTDAKLRRVRFHDLRHSFASLLLQNGESLTYVKEQMGHSSINVASRYLRPSGARWKQTGGR